MKKVNIIVKWKSFSLNYSKQSKSKKSGCMNTEEVHNNINNIKKQFTERVYNKKRLHST